MPVDVEKLAAEVVLVMKAAMAPVLARLADVEIQLERVKADGVWHSGVEPKLASLSETIGTLRERVAVVEVRPTAVLPHDVGSVGAFVAEEMKAFATRLESIEATKAVSIPGPAGEPGRDGLDGQKGLDGSPGPQGGPGPPGERGERGESGLQGLKGDVGLEGPIGTPGRDGLPGRDGMGIQGEKGIDGRDGASGVDGLRPDDFDFAYDAETRGLTMIFKRDEAVIKSVTKPLRGVPRFCGTFDSAKQYELGDMVIFGGSQWCCKAEATSAMPDLHTVDGKRDWVLSVQRGKQGSQGRDGQPGKPGKDGQIVKLGYDGKPYS